MNGLHYAYPYHDSGSGLLLLLVGNEIPLPPFLHEEVEAAPQHGRSGKGTTCVHPVEFLLHLQSQFFFACFEVDRVWCSQQRRSN